ncbi:NifU-like domain-containing protein [Desulforamulus putei DSM 12395]|uniref:NifU-like domain-containing protein n=2 Tax=Desulforamulus putei TaxID=74701 RepID=A0A1M4YMT4_9FIRM|nr:NifU-like domain-containing protein [Desulforamulus putei DSM 12395]
MREKVQEALDKVRPFLQRDGGDVELVDVDEATGVVKVKLKGACGG